MKYRIWNPLQWAIIDAISSDSAHKVFFGDYEQAIFSFMGSKLKIFTAWKENARSIICRRISDLFVSA
ncbi:MAG: UvrD-helicase domain-containing protein [Ignavibacteria bacterium]|nr:UvrD-helicase domain-containing protein [Ignavibacteria bacterium]